MAIKHIGVVVRLYCSLLLAKCGMVVCAIKVLNINSNKPSVVLFRPTKYGECTKAADDLRARKAVIVNMEDVDASTACRVVDFLSGCAYALDGKVRKIASDTYLFCPQSMDVMGDLETISTETEATV